MLRFATILKTKIKLWFAASVPGGDCTKDERSEPLGMVGWTGKMVMLVVADPFGVLTVSKSGVPWSAAKIVGIVNRRMLSLLPDSNWLMVALPIVTTVVARGPKFWPESVMSSPTCQGPGGKGLRTGGHPRRRERLIKTHGLPAIGFHQEPDS